MSLVRREHYGVRVVAPSGEEATFRDRLLCERNLGDALEALAPKLVGLGGIGL